MKRYFVNQSGDSNKFWNIETEDETQTIVFGKINTQGREVFKTFATPEKCQSATEKLISQKLEKGYVEVFEKADISEKTSLSEEAAEESFFWDSIKKSNKRGTSNWRTYDVDEHLENLTKLLSKSSKEKLIQFEKWLQINLHKLYIREIGELYIILNEEFKNETGRIIFDNYISEDGFIYFRCWLILKGKRFFDDILKNLNVFVSGKYSFNIGDTWAEGLLYAADNAYSINHPNNDECEIRDAAGEMYPEVIHYDSPERTMENLPRDGSKLQKIYPKLVKEITDLRTV